MSDDIILDVENCARCEEHHDNLRFTTFTRPIVLGKITYEYYAPCPTSGDPILLRSQVVT